MKKIVILTGNELRHEFFRKKIACSKDIHVLKTFCEESPQRNAESLRLDLRQKHLLARLQSENDFFKLFIDATVDKSNPEKIVKGTINNSQYINTIKSLNPDLIIVYGASILKPFFIETFPNKILNVHLGLSPYYRGSATNFWALVDHLPECVGASFMFIDAGIDTGEIIHQVRASINFYDTPSSIGNRLIADMTNALQKLIINFEQIEKPTSVHFNELRRICRNMDFNEEAVRSVYENFEFMIEKYLQEKIKRDEAFPVIENKIFLN